MAVIPEAAPFQHDGGEVGVLICHGFTGSPASVRPWAEYLAEASFTVDVPLLPGHGTSWMDLNRTNWEQWYATVDSALTGLRARCSTVVVCGLSMGGTLALALAQRRPHDVDALILVNPAVVLTDPRLRLLPVLSRVLPSLPAIGNDINKPGMNEHAYDRTPLRALHSFARALHVVRAGLGGITQPTLLFRSPRDHVVPPVSSTVLMESVSSADLTQVVCADSYHVATLDYDAPRIFKGSVEFIERIAAARTSG